MADDRTLLEQATDALKAALTECSNPRRIQLIEEALRLHRLFREADPPAPEKPDEPNAELPPASPRSP